MHATCFDKHWLFSGGSKIAGGTAVFPSLSSIFGVCPHLCADMSVTCISILCIICVVLSYVHVYVLALS
jgi:hypothetical protein